MSIFSHYILLLLTLLSLLSTPAAAEARIDNLLPPSTLQSSKRQAEKFIRELNLFPRNDVNIVEEDPAADAPKIVEKRFQFPYLSYSQDGNSTGATVEDFGHHAGYYRLPHTKGARMFYFFFESRKKNINDPVVLWLTVGPGCSSSLALFYENGPFQLTNNLSLVWNDFGWDKESNLIYIDQPTGTGFSYSSDRADIRTSSEEASVDFYDFLQAFFEKHPQYAKNDFYITGESYAGHYIPVFAAQIHQRNKNNEGLHINLKGIAIGNGLTNPEIQYKAYPDYALDMKLIDKSQYNNLSQSASTCQQEIRSCGANRSSACSRAYWICNNFFNEILAGSGEEFLNKESVKNALGVGDIVFVLCSSVVVYEAMRGDWIKNFEVGLPELLQDGIRLLIYAGEYDLICNWLVDDVKAGEQKNHGPLTFLKVYNAGHMVPMDQPKASLEMLRRWIAGKPL
ncbi:UNVERIFIED_CONTAM: Serine carboxypeptidase-like 48 [Sesamum latifolium]|uniref:Carboxypeptidase n=1 Tax=Sesamum latifolium TaxID=2727402 RepID=A0AAW2Y366_9LAMI